jgi:prefoldin subunit 5
MTERIHTPRDEAAQALNECVRAASSLEKYIEQLISKRNAMNQEIEDCQAKLAELRRIAVRRDD